MSSLEWKNEKRKVKDLVPYEINPRKMTEKEAKDLEKSLKKFNLVETPAINLDNKICAGHQRVNIMMLMGKGDEEIDVRVPNRMLTPEEFKEYNLRSNKNTGSWDLDLLSQHFDISDLKEVGFEPDFINMAFDLSLDEDDKGPGTKDIKETVCPKCGHTWEA